jgi:TPP-dependent 2-oxoacid decarboxylase
MRTNYPDEIDLGTFIVERWKQAGVGHVFGVPGDFNLGVSLVFIPTPVVLGWPFGTSP